MTFRSFDDALIWAKKFGRENCRPCDKWEIVEKGHEYLVAIKYKVSGDLIGYAV